MTAEIIVIGVIVSVSCALCGVFLLLRRMSLMSDAISHSVILGIVLGYFASRSLSSPLPVAGAVIAGLFSVFFTEMLQKTKLVKSDAAIGLVFPAMFSAGVLLVSLYAGNVHLDTDAALLGEIGLAPLDRVSVFGLSFPRSMVNMSIILLGNLIFLILFFKELKISTFDPGLSQSLGFSPAKINYGLMLAVSITCVGAFDSVGAVLVTALMIAPAAAALLLTDSLFLMLVLAAAIASVSSILGYFLAVRIDGSIAGAIASMTGILFCAAYLFSPKAGLIRQKLTARRLKTEFAISVLAVHLSSHRGTKRENYECRESHLTEDINWTKKKAERTVKAAIRSGIAERKNGLLLLTPKGETLAEKALTEI